MGLWWKPFRRTWPPAPKPPPLVTSSKYCVAGNDGTAVKGYTGLLDGIRYYDWGIGGRVEPKNFARMVWGLGDFWQNQRMSAHISWAGTVAAEDYRRRIYRTWFIGNELDINVGHAGSNTIGGVRISSLAGAPLAAGVYHTVYARIKANDPRATIYAGGCLQLGVAHTQNWWAAFVGASALSEIQNQHVHVYPRLTVACANPFAGTPGGKAWPRGGDWCLTGATAAADTWAADYHTKLGLHGSLKITEAGAFGYNKDVKVYGDTAWKYIRNRVMRRLKTWFDAQSRYSAIYWYKGYEPTGANWPNSLIGRRYVAPGTPSLPGNTYYLNKLGKEWTGREGEIYIEE